jgi:hypothetical protein
VNPRIAELVIFAFLLPLCVAGLVVAIRRARSWIAACIAGILACVGTMAVNLHGYAIAGAPAYSIDHRRPREHSTPGQIALAVGAFALSTAICFVVRARTRRRHA